MAASKLVFTSEELREVTEVVESNSGTIHGGRYVSHDGSGEFLWG
jgi:hypothetical protein